MLHQQLAGAVVHALLLFFSLQLVELPIGFLKTQPLSVPSSAPQLWVRRSTTVCRVGMPGCKEEVS